jgi:hypothetical protein
MWSGQCLAVCVDGPPRYYFTQLHCKLIGCLTKLQYMNFMYMYTCLLCIHESVGMNIVREKQ